MPIATSVLVAHLNDDVDEVMTIYLHTGDPGTAGTSDRIAPAVLGSSTIPTTAWAITNASATVNQPISFGNASEAITGVSHFSLFKGSNLYAYGPLASAQDVADGSAVSIVANQITVSYSSS